MNPKSNYLAAVVIFSAGTALAQNPFQTGNESSGVQNRRGNTSPTEAESNINEYTQQDEQINIDPNSGVVKVLRVDQKNLINDYVTELIPISNVFPREIRNVMRTVTGLEGGSAEVYVDRDGHEEFVQVICPRFQLDRIRATIKALDVPWLEQGRDGSVTGSYSTKFRPAESLDQIASFYAGEGATQVDRFLNRVSRRDEPFRTAMYLAACEGLDKLPPQAHLEFRVYEVDTNNDLSLGVDWIAWKNGPGRALFDLIFAGQESHERYDNATGSYNPTLGAATILGDGNVHAESTQLLLSTNYLLTSAFLDFLRVKGKARVLADANVYAANNQIGTYTATDRFLSFAATPSDPSAFGIEPRRLNTASVDGSSPDFAAHNRFLNYTTDPAKSLGLTLRIHPVIGTETSEVEVEFISDDLAGTTPQGTPIITHRRIVTKLRLRDGQSFVFGGLTRNEDLKSSNKAPWLGDIPVLGYLFGQENTAARRKEIVITAIPRFYHGAPNEIEDAMDRDTVAMVEGTKEKAFGPKNCFGFDKWMFDRIEHP